MSSAAATKIASEEGIFILRAFIFKSKMKTCVKRRHSFGYFSVAADTKNAGSVFEQAMPGPKGESQGWLSYKSKAPAGEPLR